LPIGTDKAGVGHFFRQEKDMYSWLHVAILKSGVMMDVWQDF
jgi:hypothetical protein